MGLAKSIITPTETMTALTMIQICSGGTMPTAVMTESSEKTISSARICARTTPTLTDLPPAACSSSSRFDLAVDLIGGLGDQEQAADEQDEIPPSDFMVQEAEEGLGEAHDPADGEEEPHAHEGASPSPVRATLSRFSGGSLDDKMEMNTTLSMPRTISIGTESERDPDVFGSSMPGNTRMTPFRVERETESAPIID